MSFLELYDKNKSLSTIGYYYNHTGYNEKRTVSWALYIFFLSSFQQWNVITNLLTTPDQQLPYIYIYIYRSDTYDTNASSLTVLYFLPTSRLNTSLWAIRNMFNKLYALFFSFPLHHPSFPEYHYLSLSPSDFNFTPPSNNFKTTYIKLHHWYRTWLFIWKKTTAVIKLFLIIYRQPVLLSLIICIYIIFKCSCQL